MQYDKIDQKLIKCFNRRLAVMIHGPVGTGKSAAVKRVTEKLDIDLIDMRLTQMDAVDLRGLPDPSADNEYTVWLPPEELPREGKGILFLDELNLAPPSVQHAAYQLILQRKLGKYRLPDGWVCMAAGNRLEDRARVNELSSPLANRMVHIDLDLMSKDTWDKWAAVNGIIDNVRAFIQYDGTYLYKFDKDHPANAFPTPRTWEFLSILTDGETDTDEMLSDAIMAVGKEAASAYMAFVEIFSKINPESILARHETYVFPEDQGMKSAVIIGLAFHVKNLDEKTMIRFLQLMCRKELTNEYATLGTRIVFSGDNQEKMQEIMKNNKKLNDTLHAKLKVWFEECDF